MPLIVICEGAKTCLKDCECNTGPHESTRGKGCNDPGSCYHNDHTDGQYHEYGHILHKQ